MRAAAPVLLVALVAACAPRSSPVPSGEARGVEAFEVGGHRFHLRELANGLRALAVRDPEAPEGRGSVFVVYGVGRRMEDEATSGLAHLTEHTLFTGTERTPAGRHDETIRDLGGEPNAYTRDDFTLYYDHEIPVGALDSVLAMEADRMRGLVFDRSAFERERDALDREERATRSAAQRRAELLEAAVFREHPYRFGVPDLDGRSRGPELTIEDVRRFYDTWYHPERAAVVVSGDLDPEAALDAVASAFGGVPRGGPAPAIPEEPIPATPASVEIDSELSREVVHHVWIGPARFENGDPGDRVALEILADALEMELADHRPRISPYTGGRLDRDLVGLSAAGPEARAALLALHVRLVAAEGPDPVPGDAATRRAIERARAEPGEAFVASGRPYFALAGRMGVHAALGHPRYAVERDAILARLTPADVRVAARRWLPGSRRTEVRFRAGGEVGPLPEDPAELAEAARDAAAADDLDRAIAAFEKLLEQGPNRMNTVIYLYSLGELRMNAGDLAGARADLERALDIVDYPAVRSLLEEVERRAAEGAPGVPPPGRSDLNRPE